MAFMERLPSVPVIVTPGNHDVPLYRVWERLFSPYRNWHRYVSSELDSATHVDGVTLVALNSSAPHRAIVGGRLSDAQLDFAKRAFGSASAEDLRIVVTHHHFIPTPDGDGGRPLPQAGRVLGLFEDFGVDAVLGGHVHQTHLLTSRALLMERDGPGVPIIACGTSTSRRGRGPETAANSFSVVRFGAADVRVTPYLRGPEDTDFEAQDTWEVARQRVQNGSGAAAGEVTS
jgi:3',5'-cyclic AMP phosphodiesterase CpdA